MNTAIIVLCVVMLICGIRFINNYKSISLNYYRKADDYIWYISEKKYNDLPYLMYQSRHDDNPSKDLKECMALAKYYLNTSYYKMYDEVEDSKKVEEYLTRMDDNRKAIGDDLSFAIADINEELEVNPVFPVD